MGIPLGPKSPLISPLFCAPTSWLSVLLTPWFCLILHFGRWRKLSISFVVKQTLAGILPSTHWTKLLKSFESDFFFPHWQHGDNPIPYWGLLNEMISLKDLIKFLTHNGAREILGFFPWISPINLVYVHHSPCSKTYLCMCLCTVRESLQYFY